MRPANHNQWFLTAALAEKHKLELRIVRKIHWEPEFAETQFLKFTLQNVYTQAPKKRFKLGHLSPQEIPNQALTFADAEAGQTTHFQNGE